MYLIILDGTVNSVEIIRNVPEDLKEDDLVEFISIKLGYFLDNIAYMLVDEDNALIYSTYQEDGTIKQDAIDYFGQHF